MKDFKVNELFSSTKIRLKSFNESSFFRSLISTFRKLLVISLKFFNLIYVDKKNSFTAVKSFINEPILINRFLIQSNWEFLSITSIAI